MRQQVALLIMVENVVAKNVKVSEVISLQETEIGEIIASDTTALCLIHIVRAIAAQQYNDIETVSALSDNKIIIISIVSIFSRTCFL